jgi:hypothetical protein
MTELCQARIESVYFPLVCLFSSEKFTLTFVSFSTQPASERNHKFESKQLTEMKKSCRPHCFSTLNHFRRLRQALNRFQGTTNFD